MPKAAVFKPLTNRATARGGKFALPEDGFVMLVPKGEAANVMDDGSEKGKRIIQVVDDAALESIMSKLLNRSGDEMLIDDEHFSHESDKTTDANGWQPLEKESLQNRADGLYGDPRWSTDGLQKVEGGVKRYVSPEFSTSTLQHLGGNRYRVMELTGLALTNRPGFRKLQKPLTNRDAHDGIVNPPAHTMHKVLLAGFLGLTETALDQLDEPNLKNRLQLIKEKADKTDTLTTELATLKNREVDEFMAKNDKVIPSSEAIRKTVRATFLANRADAEEMVAAFKGPQGEGEGDGLTDDQRARAGKKPLFNRDKAEAPKNEAALKNREETRAATIRNRAAVLCDAAKSAGRSLQWGDAWSQAESEVGPLE